MWIIFSIYHQAVTSTIPENVSTASQPIPPSFDTNTIRKIESRTVVQPLFLAPSGAATPAAQPIEPFPTVTSQPTPTTTIISTPTVTIEDQLFR